jgi:hypothetical protein
LPWALRDIWASLANYFGEQLHHCADAAGNRVRDSRFPPRTLVGVLLIVLLTFMNTRGLQLGKLIQNIFYDRPRRAHWPQLIILGFHHRLAADRGQRELL